MLGVGLYVSKLWADDYRAQRLGQPNPHALPGATPATATAILIANAVNQAATDARGLAIFAPEQLPPVLAFDHNLILTDYLRVRPQWLTKL